MSKPKSVIPIRPIDFDVAQRAVDELAEERKIPSQVYPMDRKDGEDGKGEVQQKTCRAPVKKVTVELPDYVVDELTLRAVQTKPRQTVRYVILDALRAYGLTVKDEDMVQDARRR